MAVGSLTVRVVADVGPWLRSMASLLIKIHLIEIRVSRRGLPLLRVTM